MVQQHYVDEAQIRAIRAVPYFAESKYRNLDIDGTIDFFISRYVKPLTAFTDLREGDVVADIGAGFGFLSMAFAIGSKVRGIAVEINPPRLEAARRIAQILGVADRIDWRVGALGHLPVADVEARVTYCVEVLEHVQRDRSALRDLARITAETLVLTTPNGWFPKVAHDTQLPFCHWLPLSLRERYAKICGRTDCENNNLFWSPRTLTRDLSDFEAASRFLHFSSRAEYQATFPHYLPYGTGRFRKGDGRLKTAYYAMAALLGRRSMCVMPSLASTWRRRVPQEKTSTTKAAITAL